MRYNSACSVAASSGALLEPLTLFQEPELFLSLFVRDLAAAELPTLSCNHRYGVEVFGRRLGSIPASWTLLQR
jgi:hypothetical protein